MLNVVLNQTINQTISALSSISTDVESNIREIFDLLDQEEVSEKEFQVSMHFNYLHSWDKQYMNKWFLYIIYGNKAKTSYEETLIIHPRQYMYRPLLLVYFTNITS